ncbi:hypothetical protein FocTR4_00014448 [Fusarium oxysporum f. sp. cubense]|uniref:Hsp70 protein n=2 Tax=Fusarium oxysporum species complex TaxID=171631 RepID=A0A5C6SPB8_FUSOC|nr:hypothetical protein FocTR4_00014448 [Fusarium oxysporum f. sp. cubense]
MSPQGAEKLVMAVDFGETNSSVSHTLVHEGLLSESVTTLSPTTVSNYVSGMMTCRGSSMHLEVPTLLRYPVDWVFQPLDELKVEQPGAIRHDNHQIRWGLEVQQDMSRVMSHSDNNQMLLHGFKNLMSQSDNHQMQNARLIETLRRLAQKRSCPSEIPIREMLLLVIIDYLMKLLAHAKDEIVGSKSISTIEMVICVPVFWNQQALRDMQTCVSIAMKRVDFPGVKFSDDCMENIFMISEPEAAATRLLAGPSVIKEGDVFTILDAGGGTCDALTYVVTQGLPLRLSRQAVHHSGDSCGSNALNDAFRQLLRTLLAGHDYLSQDGVTLEGYIFKLAVHDFEHLIKAGWVVSEHSKDYSLEVIGLKFDAGDPNQAENPRLRQPNQLTIRSEHLNEIYTKVCEKVSAIMEQQLHAAAQSGLKVCVELYLFDTHNRMTAIDAVSLGGVLRALDKSNGPTRVARSSYGVRCDEPYFHELHAGQPTIPGFQNSNEHYVEAIESISKKGDDIAPLFQKSATRYQTFPYWNADGTVNHGPFICQEEIWVSDEAYLDCRSFRDDHNKGMAPETWPSQPQLTKLDAQRIGVIVTDVTHLRPRFLHKTAQAQGPRGRCRRYWY